MIPSSYPMKNNGGTLHFSPYNPFSSSSSPPYTLLQVLPILTGFGYLSEVDGLLSTCKEGYTPTVASLALLPCTTMVMMNQHHHHQCPHQHQQSLIPFLSNRQESILPGGGVPNVLGTSTLMNPPFSDDTIPSSSTATTIAPTTKLPYTFSNVDISDRSTLTTTGIDLSSSSSSSSPLSSLPPTTTVQKYPSLITLYDLPHGRYGRRRSMYYCITRNIERLRYFLQDLQLLPILFSPSSSSSSTSSSSSSVDPSSLYSLSVLRTMIDSSIDINASMNNTGTNILMLACEYGYLDIVQLLLPYTSSYPSSSSLQSSLSSSLSSSSSNNPNTTTQLPLPSPPPIPLPTSSPFTPTSPLTPTSSSILSSIPSLTPLDIHANDNSGNTALLIAVQKGNLPILQELLRYGSDINATTNQGYTSLYLAISLNYSDIVDYLCSTTTTLTTVSSSVVHHHHHELPDIHIGCGPSNLTVTMLAAREGKVSLLRTLLTTNGVHNTDIILATDKNGYTPLMHACETGQLECVELLFRYQAKLMINTRNTSGYTPLMLAANAGYFPIVEYLLRNEADPFLTVPTSLLTALHFAAEKGYTSIVQILCNPSIGRMNPNARTAKDVTPVFLAAKNGHTDVVRELVCTYHADVNICDRDKRSALMYSSEGGYLDIVHLLCKEGRANVNLSHSYSGWSSVLYAAAGGHCHVIVALIHYGADIHQKTYNGRDALMIAIDRGKVSAARELIHHKANVNSKNIDNITVLMRACYEGHIGIVHELIKYGADINAIDNKYRTPLVFACENNRITVIRELCLRGADVTILNNEGKTALDIVGSKTSNEGVYFILQVVIKKIIKDNNTEDTVTNGSMHQRTLSNQSTNSSIMTRSLSNVEPGTPTPSLDPHSLLNTTPVSSLTLPSSSRGYTSLWANFIANYGEYVLPALDRLLRIHARKLRLLFNCVDNYNHTVESLLRTKCAPLFQRYRTDTNSNSNNSDSPSSLVSPSPTNVFNENLLDIDTATLNDPFVSTASSSTNVQRMVSTGSYSSLLSRSGTLLSSFDALLNMNGNFPHPSLNHNNAFRTLTNASWDDLLTIMNENDIGQPNESSENSEYQMYLEEKAEALRLISRPSRGIIDIAGIVAKYGYTQEMDKFTETSTLFYFSDPFYTKYIMNIVHGLHYRTRLMYHCRQGNLSRVQYLITCGVDINITDSNAVSPLMLACIYNHVSIVQELLKLSHLDIQSINREGYAALHLAAIHGHHEIIRELCRKGADGNLLVSDTGFSPLALACEKGHYDSVCTLLKYGKVDINLPNAIDQTTPLMYAAKNGFTNIVEYFVTQVPSGMLNLELVNKGLMTALYLAAEAGHYEIVKLLCKAGATIDHADKRKWTPLLVTARNANLTPQHKDIFMELYRRKANLKATTSAGKTVLMYAADSGEPDIVHFLCRHPDLDVNQTVPSNGYSALMYAVEEGHPEAVRILCDEGKANIHTVSKNGKDPLFVALDKGYVEVARDLLLRGANPNSSDGQGSSVLMRASRDGYLSIVTMLCNQGAQINASDSEKRTALMYAAEYGRVSIVRELCRRGADITLRNHDNMYSALDYAGMKGRTEAVATLLRYLIPLISSRNPMSPAAQTWANFIGIYGDKVSTAVESSLQMYSHKIVGLAMARDPYNREAKHMATPICGASIRKRLYLCGRYEIFPRAEHTSLTSIVYFAYDHGSHDETGGEGGGSSSSMNRSVGGSTNLPGSPSYTPISSSSSPAVTLVQRRSNEPVKVALKFMKYRNQYENEIETRKEIFGTGVTMNTTVTPSASSATNVPSGILNILAAYNGETGTDEASQSINHRGFSKTPFLLVLPAADRSLNSIIDHEWDSPHWKDECRNSIKQILQALHELHKRNILHGDIKPRNIVHEGRYYKLIDLDSSVRMGTPLTKKYSTAYIAPEIAQTLLFGSNHETNDHENINSSSSTNSPATLSRHPSRNGATDTVSSSSIMVPTVERILSNNSSLSTLSSSSSLPTAAKYRPTDARLSTDDGSGTSMSIPFSLPDTSLNLSTVSDDYYPHLLPVPESSSLYLSSSSSSSLVADPSIDVWSLGVTAYYMLTGQTLFHSDTNDNVADEQNLLTIARWNIHTKNYRLKRIRDPDARNFVSVLLNYNPLHRYTIPRLLQHTYITKNPTVRYSTDLPTYEVFLSYRVASDRTNVALLAEACENLGIKVWWDKNLIRGKRWQEGFCRAVSSSLVFVPLISAGTILESSDPRRYWPGLTSVSPCDNVLLEYRLALELERRKLIESIYPVFIGTPVDGTPTETITNSSSSNNNPTLGSFGPRNIPIFPSVSVDKVESTLHKHLNTLGLGTPMYETLTVQDVSECITGYQGGSVCDGLTSTLIEKVAKEIYLTVQTAKTTLAESIGTDVQNIRITGIPNYTVREVKDEDLVDVDETDKN